MAHQLLSLLRKREGDNKGRVTVHGLEQIPQVVEYELSLAYKLIGQPFELQVVLQDAGRWGRNRGTLTQVEPDFQLL